MKQRSIFVLVVLMLFVTGCPSPSRERTDGIFVPTSRKGDVSDPQPTVKRARAVEVAAGELAGQANITLNLFDDTTLRLVRDELRQTPRGTVWRGHVDGEPASSAIFVIRSNVIVGNILTGKGERAFELRYIGNRVHEIREIDATKFLPEGQPTAPKLPPRDPQADPCGNTDSGAEIDVMVVYNAASRTAAGGVDAMEAEIVLAIEAANQAYINSNVTQRLNLVHTEEVSYAETGSAITDRDRLQNTSDGFIDNVHALRNAHGADIVALITNTPSDFCGFAFIMDSVSTAFEPFAFADVKRSCSVSNLTFPHELAHIMSARHDWANDNTANSPFAYNHGHTRAAAPVFRTIMSTSAGTRIQFFSNPNLNYPTTADAMGVAAGMNQADNHRTLNDTALTVANFRCTSPGADNVWAKDTWNDTGAEPDPATAGEAMWKSPYIWVRRTQDATLTKQHQHENPVNGVQNFVYVKLHNGGGDTSGNLNLYFAQASAGLSWPADWTLISSQAVNAFTNHTTRVVEIPWTPAGTGHFCLVARWVSASDPMTVPETSDINANTRNNNNIVWRNVNVVALGGDTVTETVRMLIRDVGRSREQGIYAIAFRTPKGEPSFLNAGEVTVKLDDNLRRVWEAGGSRSTGTKPAGDALRVGDGATIDNIALRGGQGGYIEITFRRAPSTPRRKYNVDVVQRTEKQEVGGVSYEVNAEIGQ